VDRVLYLPQDWAADPGRREQTHVPAAVPFRESWRIGLDLLDRSAADLAFGWVAGDDEFGRCSEFRWALRLRQWHYVLDVPCNTLIRDLGEAPAPGRRRPPWQRVDAWAQALPAGRWCKVRLPGGTKGPKVVRVAEAWVQTRDEAGRAGPRERLVVIRSVEQEPQSWYTLSNTPAEVPVAQVARAHGRRHGAEELYGAGKGEVVLGHYEVRSWVGWHHHMTLSLSALWFLQWHKGALGGKNPGADDAAVAGAIQSAAASAAAECGADRRGNQRGATAERRSPDLSLVCADR
jgi:SRSO17 transposase